MADLLPCPFCGEAPASGLWPVSGGNKWAISCRNDKCTVAPDVIAIDVAIATARWNTRAPIEAKEKHRV